MKSIDLALNVANPSCNAHENEIQHELFPSNETGGSHFNIFLNFILCNSHNNAIIIITIIIVIIFFY